MINLIDDFIEINEELNIEKCFLNADKSILSLIQKGKVNFFDTKNFKEFADNLGDELSNIDICYPYYRSNICVIVGKKGNEIFPYDELSFYNIQTKEKIAKIKINYNPNDLEDKIYNVIIVENTLFIILHHKILMFYLIDLKLLYQFTDINGKKGFISINSIKEKIALAYISNMNNKIIKIYKIRMKNYEKKKKILYTQHTLCSDFDKIQYISISPLCKFLAVVSGSGDKINIYSLLSYNARKYLWRGYGNVKIIGIEFDHEAKFMCLLSNQKTFHIYPLLRRNLNITAKTSEDDEQDYYNYGRTKPSKVKTLFKFIRNKWGRKYQESYAKYKDERVLENEIILFYFDEKKDLIIFDKLGSVFIVKFNKRNGGMCWLHQRKYLEVTEF